jgi:SAM-dependent methyltransferase
MSGDRGEPRTIRAGSDVLPPPSQRVVSILEHIADAIGHPIESGSRVLDFGAGAGRHVAEFRDRGYDAWGADQSFESHEEGSVSETFLRRVSPPDYRLPFPENHFAFVYSMEVMEHVLDPGQALSQVARVLRPDGISIHVFPSRWRPVEPHMLVPLGGRFQSFSTLRLWAHLGIRNSWQQGLSPTEVALANVQYCKTGTSYPTAREWTLRAEQLFTTVGWAERHFVAASTDVSRVSHALAPVSKLPLVERVYRGFHTRVLVLGRPRELQH